MEENIATRLKLFIDTNGLTSSQFADMCGISRSSLSQILSGRNKKVSDGLVKLIHDTFPNLSVLWLMFGEGPVTVPGASPVLDGAGSTGVSVSPSSGNPMQNGGDSSEIEREFRKENSENMGNRQDAREYSTQNALNHAENGSNPSRNQILESDLKIMDLKNQIEQMRKNPRKVIQITIYYDDSTFETFIPKP